MAALQRLEILNRITKHYQTISSHHSKKNALQSTYIPSSSFSSNLSRFPGAMPVSLMREDVIKLYNGHRSYVFLIKSDGLRVLLYFDRIAGVPFVVSVNRRLELLTPVILQNLPADCSLYDGTLWDCEAMSDGSYQVFDNVVTNGLPCGQYDFVTRMLIVRHNLWFLRHISPRLPITDKPFYSLTNIRTLFETRHAFPTDGIIAMPVEDFVYMGHCPIMFKIKRCFDNTIDCLAVRAEKNQEQQLKTVIQNGEGIEDREEKGTMFELWVEWNAYEDEEEGHTHAAKMAWNGTTYVCWAYTVFDEKQLSSTVHRKIVECRRRSQGDPKWRIHLLRPDKVKPNSLYTALRTCRNIDENLTYETIFPHIASSSAPLPPPPLAVYDRQFLPHLKRHEKVMALKI